jgi:hypothetical protein
MNDPARFCAITSLRLKGMHPTMMPNGSEIGRVAQQLLQSIYGVFRRDDL